GGKLTGCISRESDGCCSLAPCQLQRNHDVPRLSARGECHHQVPVPDKGINLAGERLLIAVIVGYRGHQDLVCRERQCPQRLALDHETTNQLCDEVIGVGSAATIAKSVDRPPIAVSSHNGSHHALNCRQLLTQKAMLDINTLQQQMADLLVKEIHQFLG